MSARAPAHGQADQALAHAGGLALRFGQAPVRGAGRVGDGGLTSPRLVAMLHTRVLSMTWKARAQLLGAVALTLEGTTDPHAVLLAHGQLVLRVRGQAGVEHAPRRGGLQPAATAARWRFAPSRAGRVSMPLSTTQALKGESTMPAVRISGANTSSISLRGRRRRRP
jgi:hypothetical protein